MTQYVNGNVAYQLGAEELEREDLLQQPGRRLTVLPGSRPRQHAQTQTAVHPIVVTALKCATAFAVVIAAVALVRILLIASAFTVASQNSQLTAQLDAARSAGSELEVQVAVYGSKERVTSLATEVYGMVPADNVAVIDLSSSYAVAAAGQQAQ